MTPIDGGILDAVLDHLISFSETTLASVQAYGLGQLEAGDEGKFPSIVVRMPRDRGLRDTSIKSHRRTEVTIVCRATSYSIVGEIFAAVSQIVSDIEESPGMLSERMPAGAGVMGVDVLDTQLVRYPGGHHAKSLTLQLDYEVVR